MRKYLTDSLTLATFLLVAAPASTAEIDSRLLMQNADRKIQLVIDLKGQISEGDASRIVEIVAESTLFSSDESNDIVVSLDSEGGSFEEALKLADLFSEIPIGTYVGADAVCMSACAIAFLGGKKLSEEANSIYTDRTMHPSAKLGFHAPSLGLSGTSLVPADLLEKSYSTALQAVAGIVDRNDDLKIEDTLLLEIVRTPPDDFYMVEILDDAARWSIAIDTDNTYRQFDDENLGRACMNFEVWKEGKQAESFDYDYYKKHSIDDQIAPPDQMATIHRKKVRLPHYEYEVFLFPTLIYEYTIYCALSIFQTLNPPETRFAFSYSTSSIDSIIQSLQTETLNQDTYPWYFMLDSKTPISSLKARTTRLTPKWRHGRSGRSGKCVLFDLSGEERVFKENCSLSWADNTWTFSGLKTDAAFFDTWRDLREQRFPDGKARIANRFNGDDHYLLRYSAFEVGDLCWLDNRARKRACFIKH